MKLRALDLFCGGGGAAIGLHWAGFDEIVGIDIKAHRNYPFNFIQADIHHLPVDVWASPPCQRFSLSTQLRAKTREAVIKHADFIPFVRELLSTHQRTCIENVPHAPIRADVVLTAPSLGLPSENGILKCLL